MDFGYGQSFAEESPDAYERLLLDVMLGDQTLFIRRDETEAAWRAVMPILEAWEADPAPRAFPPTKPAAGDPAGPATCSEPTAFAGAGYERHCRSLAAVTVHVPRTWP